MKVDFNFGATAEITLTPESPKEESLVKMCYEVNLYPTTTRTNENKIRLIFSTCAQSSCPDVSKFIGGLEVKEIRLP